MTRIAIIDDCINPFFLRGNWRIINGKNGETYTWRFASEVITHSTIIAAIIESGINIQQAELYNLVIKPSFEQNGSVLSLLRAVEWCIKNKIEIINLSLGSTAYNDQELLQSLSNRLEEHKICLVAATANNGQTTYPANFRNVIGVRYCDLLTADQHKYFQNPSDGIEIISGCPTNINQICFDPCNSFATAIISSKVCNFYQTELNHPYDKTRKYLMDTAL